MTPEMIWVEAPSGANVTGEEVWDLDDDDSWLFEVVAKLKRREKAYVEALKFNESDWARNRGRFARYIGQGGGGGRSGGAGAATGEGEGVEDAVGPITEKQRKNAEDWFAERGLSRESMAEQARSMLSPQALEDGKVWYQEGHDYSAELGARHGISTDAAAGAVAALSPNTEWELNKRVAESLVRQTTAERFTLQQDEVDTRLAEIEKRGEMTPRRLEEHRQFLQRYVGSTRTSRIPTEDLAKLVGGSQVFANKEKAIRIVRGERPRTVLGDGSGSRTGMKVRSFYDNLTRPSTSQEVTIDRRMIDALLGSGSQVSEADRAAIFSNPARYGVMRDAVRGATPLGLLPHQAQAAVWGAQGPVRARGKAVGETFIDEDTGTLRDWDAYATEVAESMLLGGSTSEEVDEMLRLQRHYLGVGRVATKAQTDALLYVLDLWGKEKLKFVESDWVRNRGRFADYIGRGSRGGSGGGSSGTGEPGDPLKFDPVWIGGAASIQRQLVPHYADWAATVTPAERQALVDYAANSGPKSFGEVNGYLRHPDAIEQRFARRPEPFRSEAIAAARERQAKTAEAVAVLDSALARASSPEMLVYRGFGFEGRNMAVGDTFLDRGFTSTSANLVNATDFGSTGGSTGVTTVGEIRVPKGTRAVAINAVINPSGDSETHVPGTRNEAEVLIDRGSVYRVTGQRRETIEYDTPSGKRQRNEVNILEIEMVNDAGDVPQLGETERARRRRGDRFVWGDDDIVMLVTEEKFSESDWVRNSGRFADFVGRSGGSGGSGGSSGATTEFAKQLFDVEYDRDTRARVVAQIKSEAKYDPSTWEKNDIYNRPAEELSQFGFTVRSTDTFGQFGQSGTIGGGQVVASNRTGRDGTIHINAEAWDSQDAFGREVLLHHELGHNAARVMLADGSGQKVMGFYPSDKNVLKYDQTYPFGANPRWEEQLSDASGFTTQTKGVVMTGMPSEYDRFAGPRDLDSDNARNRARVYTNITAVNEALGYNINPQTREAVDRYRAMEGYGETWPGGDP